MANIEDELSDGIARRIRAERTQRGWSLAELAENSNVSKAMLSAIERGEASPTAMLLVRIAGAFGMTLSSLIARAELQAGRLLKERDQPRWVDPETGYRRRHLSPASDMPLELIHVELPEGASASFPAATYAFIRQQIWLIEGRLDFHEGESVHEMHAGDCLALGSPADCTFRAPGPGPAVYLVALVRQ
jgi:transcriptional regulator with XRE-family HTH domain